MLENRINRVTIRNYRSLKDVTVELDDLTVLVGANASGKSNFLDALKFVRDALTTNLSNAVKIRGGIQKILYSGFSEITIAIALGLGDIEGEYDFTLQGIGSNFVVKQENCSIGEEYFHVQNGVLHSSNILREGQIHIKEDVLVLPLFSAISGITLYKKIVNLANFLLNMSFYNVLPNQILFPEELSSSYPLAEDIKNLSSVLNQNILTRASEANEINYSLAAIIPDIQKNNAILVEQFGNHLLTKLHHTNGWFDLTQESNGTLRTLAIMVALYQSPALPLMAIEEPELMIHPRALPVLCDEISEAAIRGQIIITTHSPDIIARFPPESLRIVEMVDGATQIGKLTEYQRQVINDQIFNGGDLLRIEGLKRE